MFSGHGPFLEHKMMSKSCMVVNSVVLRPLYSYRYTVTSTTQRSVSPSAALAREHPTATVCSIDTASRREGLTSSMETHKRLIRYSHVNAAELTMISKATRQPVSATASVI